MAKKGWKVNRLTGLLVARNPMMRPAAGNTGHRFGFCQCRSRSYSGTGETPFRYNGKQSASGGEKPPGGGSHSPDIAKHASKYGTNSSYNGNKFPTGGINASCGANYPPDRGSEFRDNGLDRASGGEAWKKGEKVNQEEDKK